MGVIAVDPGGSRANHLPVYVHVADEYAGDRSAVAVVIDNLELRIASEREAGQHLLRAAPVGLAELRCIDLGETDFDLVALREQDERIAVLDGDDSAADRRSLGERWPGRERKGSEKEKRAARKPKQPKWMSPPASRHQRL
jgi:hypothetical protein